MHATSNERKTTIRPTHNMRSMSRITSARSHAQLNSILFRRSLLWFPIKFGIKENREQTHTHIHTDRMHRARVRSQFNINNICSYNALNFFSFARKTEKIIQFLFRSSTIPMFSANVQCSQSYRQCFCMCWQPERVACCHCGCASDEQNCPLYFCFIVERFAGRNVFDRMVFGQWSFHWVVVQMSTMDWTVFRIRRSICLLRLVKFHVLSPSEPSTCARPKIKSTKMHETHRPNSQRWWDHNQICDGNSKKNTDEIIEHMSSLWNSNEMMRTFLFWISFVASVGLVAGVSICSFENFLARLE